MRALLMAGVGIFALSPCWADVPNLNWKPLDEPGSGGWLTSLTIDPKDSNHLILGGDMLGAGVSTDGGKSWQATTGFTSWEMADATFKSSDPREVWMGTMSGPYVSHDGGSTWESRRQGLLPVGQGYYSTPIQKIWIDPRNEKRLLAFGGSWRRWSSNGGDHLGTVWESLDAGSSWSEYSKIKKTRYTISVGWSDAKPGTFYAVVDEKGLFKSVDDAKTWQPIKNQLPPSGLSMVAVDPTNPDIVWLSTGCRSDPSSKNFIPGGIYKSQDGGLTWNLSVTGLPQKSSDNGNFTTDFSPLVVAPSNPNVLYTSDDSWDAPAIYRSDDGGKSWQRIYSTEKHNEFPTAYTAGLGATVLSVDPHNPDIFYAAGSESVIVTRDGGKTWADITSEQCANRPGAWAGHGFSGLCSINVKFNPFKANDCVLMAMDAGRFIHSVDGYKSWNIATQGFDWAWGGGSDVSFAGKNGEIIYGAFGQGGGSGNIAKSLDGGKSWIMCGASADSGLPPKNQGTATSVYALPYQPDEVWAVYNGNLYRSTDGGQKWAWITGVHDAYKIVADPHTPLHFYVSLKDGIVETQDGQSFIAVSGSPSGIRGFAIEPDNSKILWIATDSGLVKLADGKAEMIKADPATYDVAFDPSDPKRIALATCDDPYHDVSNATGVWVSGDGGQTWSQENNGLPCLRGRTITFNPHNPQEIIFGTFGRGYFITQWPKIK